MLKVNRFEKWSTVVLVRCTCLSVVYPVSLGHEASHHLPGVQHQAKQLLPPDRPTGCHGHICRVSDSPLCALVIGFNHVESGDGRVSGNVQVWSLTQSSCIHFFSTESKIATSEVTPDSVLGSQNCFVQERKTKPTFGKS